MTTKHRRRLKTYVHVRGDGPDAGYVAFGPDDLVPEWAVRKIGPHAWEDDDAEDAPPAVSGSMSLIGGAFEPGALISAPTTTTSGLLPPSASPTAGRTSSTTRNTDADAEKGLDEAARRFGARPPDTAA